MEEEDLTDTQDQTIIEERKQPAVKVDDVDRESYKGTVAGTPTRTLTPKTPMERKNISTLKKTP